MKILGPLIFVGMILLGIFTLANWVVLSTPTPLSFIAFDLEVPLGFVLLGAMLVFVALFTAYVLFLRTAMLRAVSAHRHADGCAPLCTRTRSTAATGREGRGLAAQ